MQTAKYNVESGDILSPMDAYISAVEAVDVGFNLECKKDKDKEKMKEDKKQGEKPNPNFLQQLQIHDDDTVSTFQKVKKMRIW